MVQNIIGTSTTDRKENDTLYHTQKFHHTFAYDDGTAESAYGLNVDGAKLAYQFKLNRPDEKLRAVQMYFPQMLDAVSDIPFELIIWNHNNSQPGDTLYTQTVYPVHTENGEFHTYIIDNPFLVSGVIYIGCEQTTDDLLNIGLEKCVHEIIARMDSDDISKPNRFKVQLDFIKNNPNIAGFLVHGQVLIVIWFVVAILLVFSILGTSNADRIPHGWQNFMESAIDFVTDIAKNQLGESFYREWVPFIGTLFLFIFGSNWAGAIIPWKLIELPEGEFAAPTNDINTTVALALLTSFAYFYAGLSKKGLGYFKRYVQPIPLLLPINILEDFTKPLSLSFRLFGNVLADELTITVLTGLVPLVIPLPIMLLGIFAGSVQALIFSTLAAAYIAEALE